MTSKAFSTVTDQVTERLRRDMKEGRWREILPGRKRLAAELGCSQWTVEEATRRLAKEGLLISHGAGRRHKIMLPKKGNKPRKLRLMILLYEESDRKENYLVELAHRLQNAGHQAIFAEKTMRDLGMSVGRITRFVENTETDAWVVMAGSREILEWFSSRATPTFALFGRVSHVSLASISLRKADALIELADHLVDLGHRRIVILAREERRKPTPALLEQLFLNRLEDRGIKTGSYNLPDWGNSPMELGKVLDSLFRYTPPTALIVDQPALCVAVLQHFSRLGISAPADVSLACTDQSNTFEWCFPTITHIAWDARPVINRVVKWADYISHGKDDRRKSTSKVRIVQGGTVGPADRRT